MGGILKTGGGCQKKRKNRGRFSQKKGKIWETLKKNEVVSKKKRKIEDGPQKQKKNVARKYFPLVKQFAVSWSLTGYCTYIFL